MSFRHLVLVAFLGIFAARGEACAQEPRFLDRDPYYWIDELKSPKSSARRAAAFALGKLGAATFAFQGLRPLVDRLTDKESDAEVRDSAAFALGEIGLALRKYRESAVAWREASGALLQALGQDKDARVRRSAAYGIGGFGRFAASARVPLQTALQDESPGVRQNAAWALGQLGNEGGAQTVEGLAKVFGDADPLVRRDAAAAVGEIGRLRGPNDQFIANPAVGPLLQLFNNEKDTTIRKVALDALVNAVTPQDKQAAKELHGLLADKDPEIVRSAALALGNIGGKEADEAVRVLRQALREGDVLTRIQASAALANVGEGAVPAVPDLIHALDDKESGVRRSAALALSRIGPKAGAAVPALTKHLHAAETNEEVRKFAAEALAQMNGDDLVPVIPDLLQAIHDDKASPVRQRCIWALFNVRDLEGLQIVEPLTAVLSETDEDHFLVRYDAARCLAVRLGGKAPEKAVDVLLQMLNDKRIRLYEGSGADVTGSSVEGSKGGATVAMTYGGDARFLAAHALGRIGRPKATRPAVIEALEEAAKSPDKETRETSKEALKIIQGKK
jgi:HEAT repeat protein